MTREIDELIFRVLNAEASAEELQFLSDWIKEEEHEAYFLKLKKLWNMTSGPHITPERKSRELKRYLNSIHRISTTARRRLLIRWCQYAAVLLLPLTILVALFSFPSGELVPPCVPASIHPGISQAILTTSEGDTLVLAAECMVDMQLQEAVKVKSGERGIVYEHTGKVKEAISYNTLSVPRGGEYTVVLSDGTKVFLNAESRLTYPVLFVSDQRRVEIEGEGYFEVAHDPEHPFVVRVNGMEIRVYGTEFNVNTYEPGKVQTTLVKGCVGIQVLATGEEVVLQPEEMACFEIVSSSVKVSQVDTYFYTAWKNGKFIFENESLEKIMQQLGRWYNIEVRFENERVKKTMFTGIMTRYGDIAVLLDILQETTLVNFEVKGHTIVVK